MISFPAPSPINGDLLARQLADAGLTADVYVAGDTLELVGLDEPARGAAQAVVDAHPATARAFLDAAQAERTNETAIRNAAEQALAVNRAFLGLANPNDAQKLAQVKALTRQNTVLIRLLLNKFDGTD